MRILVRAARVGEQSYPTGPEYRDAADVFDPSSLASWVGSPVLVGHKAWVDSSNVSALAVGYVARVVRDGDHVLATVVITDASTARAIERGDLIEASAGYNAEMVGNRQTQIRINHLALLPPGGARCGPSCSVVS